MKESREYILKVAFKLFLKKSYKEVTMRELVEKTKLSKGAFYYYFPSKESLFIEVIEKYFFSFFQFDYHKFSTTSLNDFFHNYITGIKSLMQEISVRLNITSGTDLINYYMIMFEAGNHLVHFKEKVIQMHKVELDSWMEIVRIARKNCEIKTSMTDKHVAQIFISISDGLGINAIVHGKIDNLPEHVVTLWEKFYNEIKS